MIDDMLNATLQATTSHVKAGNPSPPHEFVMHPDAFSTLKSQARSEQSGLLNRRSEDGVWEFMNTPIREDDAQVGWTLLEIKPED